MDSVVLTSKSTDFAQLFTEGALPIDIQIVAHKASITEKTEASAFFPTGEDFVPIISYLCVSDTFLVASPETLYASRTLGSVALIVAPRPLDTSSHIMPIAIAHRLQREQL